MAEDAALASLTNELEHMSLTRPQNRYDCVYVTLGKLTGIDVVSLGASITSKLRPLPGTQGVSLDELEPILFELNGILSQKLKEPWHVYPLVFKKIEKVASIDELNRVCTHEADEYRIHKFGVLYKQPGGGGGHCVVYEKFARSQFDTKKPIEERRKSPWILMAYQASSTAQMYCRKDVERATDIWWFMIHTPEAFAKAFVPPYPDTGMRARAYLEEKRTERKKAEEQ